MILLPYEVRTLYQRSPWGNLALILLTVVVSIYAWSLWAPEPFIDSLVLARDHPLGLIGHLFLHAGLLHLFGNMLFLFIFGNAVCGVTNGFLYTGLYIALGVAASAAHLLSTSVPAIGASGAISGIIGVYLAIYPSNEVNCFWFLLFRGGTFGIPGWVIILFWFALDLYGALHGSENIAYWAHVGGTVTGFLAGLLLLKVELIDIFDYDHPTTLHWISEKLGR